MRLFVRRRRVRGGGDQALGLFVERFKLGIHALGQERIDGVASDDQILSHAPPGAKASQNPRRRCPPPGPFAFATAGVVQALENPRGRLRLAGQFVHVSDHDIQIAHRAETAAKALGGLEDGLAAAAGKDRFQQVDGRLEPAGADAGIVDGFEVKFG